MTQYPELVRSELVAVIHDVRKRWRMKLALRGAAIAARLRRGGAGRLRGDAAVDAIHAGVHPAVQDPAGDGGRGRWPTSCVVRPLLRSVTDEQVALYLEEHEPSLEAAIISAVEAERAGRPAAVAGARPQAGAERGREGPRARRRPARRAQSGPPLFGRARRRRRDRRRDLPARPRLHAPRAVGAAGDFAQRRSRGAVPHRGDARATRRFRAAPTSRSRRSWSASSRTRRC